MQQLTSQNNIRNISLSGSTNNSCSSSQSNISEFDVTTSDSVSSSHCLVNQIISNNGERRTSQSFGYVSGFDEYLEDSQNYDSHKATTENSDIASETTQFSESTPEDSSNRTFSGVDSSSAVSDRLTSRMTEIRPANLPEPYFPVPTPRSRRLTGAHLLSSNDNNSSPNQEHDFNQNNDHTINYSMISYDKPHLNERLERMNEAKGSPFDGGDDENNINEDDNDEEMAKIQLQLDLVRDVQDKLQRDPSYDSCGTSKSVDTTSGRYIGEFCVHGNICPHYNLRQERSQLQMSWQLPPTPPPTPPLILYSTHDGDVFQDEQDEGVLELEREDTEEVMRRVGGDLRKIADQFQISQTVSTVMH